MATATETTWRLEGTLLIACNCDYGCPCNFNAPPSHGKCEGGWIWHVEEGRFGNVSLDGLAMSVFCDWPGAIHEGGGKAICLYDERADEAQAEAIEALARGRHGGPWGIFINTYEFEDVRPSSFELHLDDLASKVKIGDAVELELMTIKNPVTGAEVHPRALLPEGLVCKEMSLGASARYSVDDRISYDHGGQYAAIAPFDYSAS